MSIRQSEPQQLLWSPRSGNNTGALCSDALKLRPDIKTAIDIAQRKQQQQQQFAAAAAARPEPGWTQARQRRLEAYDQEMETEMNMKAWKSWAADKKTKSEKFLLGREKEHARRANDNAQRQSNKVQNKELLMAQKVHDAANRKTETAKAEADKAAAEAKNAAEEEANALEELLQLQQLVASRS